MTVIMGVPHINEEKLEVLLAIVGKKKIYKINEETKYQGKKCSCEGERSLWMVLRLKKNRE